MIHRDRGLVTDGRFRIRTEPLKETLYRYRAINEWLKPILVHDELYFATPEACNDPFDCRFEASLDDPVHGLKVFLAEQRVVAPMMQLIGQSYSGPLPEQLAPSARLAAMTDAELSRYAEEIYKQLDLGNPERQGVTKGIVEGARNRIGVCCFAGRGDDLLMHAHYAAQHSGCCLEFQIRDAHGHRQSIFEEPGLMFWDVLYQDQPPVVHLLELGTVESVQRVTLTKHSRWAYEEEVRVVRFKGPGPVRYRREALIGLIFSYKTSEKDVEQVLDWLGPRSGVALSRAVPAQDARLQLVPM
jgi:hypothetical protein